MLPDGPRDLIRVTFDALLESGELLAAGDFRRRLGWSHDELREALSAHRLFCVEADGVVAYPAFYLDKRYNRKDIESIIESLGDISGGSKWLFFTTPRGSLAVPVDGSPTARARAGEAVELPFPREGTSFGPSGVARTPLKALEAGDLARVQRAAEAYAES